MDYDSAFNTEVRDTQNTHTRICDVSLNVDVTTGPTQFEEANLTHMTKAQAIQNMHYCVGHIAPGGLRHLVENGSYLHVPIVDWPRPSNLVSQGLLLPLTKSEYYCLQIRHFEVESLEGSIYKICIIEAKTRFLWMTMAATEKVDGVLDQWFKDTFPWMRGSMALRDLRLRPSMGSLTVKHART